MIYNEGNLGSLLNPPLLGYWFIVLLVYYFTGSLFYWFIILLVHYFTGSLFYWFTVLNLVDNICYKINLLLLCIYNI